MNVPESSRLRFLFRTSQYTSHTYTLNIGLGLLSYNSCIMLLSPISIAYSLLD